MEFTAFDIEAHPTCDYDHLTITDDDGTTLLDKSCGSISDDNIVIGGVESILPATIISASNIVTISFSSDDSETRPGWNISWSAEEPGECQ